MFDPEAFGQAMGEAIRKAVQPLHEKIAVLEKDLEDMAAQLQSEVHAWNQVQPEKGDPGKDCDMEQVKAWIDEAIKAIPIPKDGRDGQDGKDGRDGVDGKDGERGEKGADGIGVAGAMIDRDGNLVATMSNGEVKNLGPVVGKDGRNGEDGKDGASFESFDLEYLPETHEMCVKASAGGRTKEIRFPAGGIRPGGYWREGIKAKSGEVWVEGGTSYICNADTATKPDSANAAVWTILARKGRDGETTVKTVREGPPPPIKLGGA